MRWLVELYVKSRGQLPKHIVVLRDGLPSDSHLNAVSSRFLSGSGACGLVAVTRIFRIHNISGVI